MAQVKVGGPAAGLAEAVGSSAETAAALSVAEAAAADGTTLSGTIAQRLRDEILSGGRAPGARLRLEDLRSRFGVSWSPLREAVSRLVAEGLIVADGARSYQVAPATRRELAETACRVAGVPAHPIVHELRRAGEVERNFATYDLARERLGFEPTMTVEQALARTWQWMQRQATPAR